MRIVFLVFLCGLAAAWAFHVPRELGHKEAIRAVDLGGALDGILKLLENVVSNVLTVPDFLLKGIPDLVKTALTSVGEISGEALKLVENLVEKATGTVKKVLEEVLGMFRDHNKKLEKSMQRHHSIRKSMIENVVIDALKLIEKLIEKGEEVGDKVLKTLDDAVSMLLQLRVKVSDKVITAMKKIHDGLTGQGKKIVGDLIDKLEKNSKSVQRSMDDELKNKLDELIQKITETLITGKESVLDYIGKLVQVVTDIAKRGLSLKEIAFEKLHELIEKVRGKIDIHSQIILDFLENLLKK